jgi:hypothetical protein
MTPGQVFLEIGLLAGRILEIAGGRVEADQIGS